MNFVDPKEIDIPRHGTKNRYKTILPSKFLELNTLPIPYHFPLSQLLHTHQIWNCKHYQV